MYRFTNFNTWGIFLFVLFSFSFQNARAQYTLQDDDVVISGGVISACIYDFSSKEIIIPETLQGQTVIGIADASASNTGAFYNKGITSISFPQSIQFIGNNSFRSNAISTIDLSNLTNLTRIGSYAFVTNTTTALNLSGCSSLTSIEPGAFQQCDLISIDFTGCTSLQNIGDQAFYDNAITSLDFSPLTSLLSIGNRAFVINSISNVNFSNCIALSQIGEYTFCQNLLTAIDITPCTGLMKIGQYAFSYNTITSFVLPIVAGYEALGWRNSSNQVFAGGDATTNLTASYFVPVPYTLTDADVVVTDGILTTCSYSFASKDIIIPDTLDGQAVTGLKGGPYGNSGVFYNKGIFSVVLPTTLEIIQDYAFSNNKIRKLDLSPCSGLKEIGKGNFSSQSMTELNLNGCSELTAIGDAAFSGNAIGSLDLSSCTSLKTIGTNAFYQNPINSLNLSGCGSLERIYENAFYYNTLNSVDISYCTSLIYIGSSAFYGNNISSFTLPTPTAYESLGWRDYYGTMHSAGETITLLNLSYKVPVPYTLTDDDVVATDGVITSCSYNFFFTDIIIPDTLDGQLVIKIADGTSSTGIFISKNITSVQLPSTIESIGNYAFYNNKLTEVDFSLNSSLQKIGSYAFNYNKLTSLNLSNCSELLSIGDNAFYGYYDGTRNNLNALDFSDCTKLVTIGSAAFMYNSISSISFENCNSLKSIASYAFYQNSITELNFSDTYLLNTLGDYAFKLNAISTLNISNCTSLLTIGTECFANNSVSSFVLPVVTAYESYGWRDGNGAVYTGGQTATNFTTYYKVPIPYTLTDDDVVVTNGEIVSCSYNFASKDIIVPDTLDGQVVTGIADGAYSTGIFVSKGLFTIQFPTTIQKIGSYAFRGNNLKLIDFSECHALKTIGSNAFDTNKIDSVNFENCSKLETIGSRAFISAYIRHLDLSSCISLKTIGNNAFEDNSWLGELILSGCDSLQTIGGYAFYRCRLTDVDLSVCPNLLSIGSGAFYDNNISNLNFSTLIHLKTIGSDAFYGNALTTVDLSVCDSLQTIGNYAFRSNTLTSVNLSCPLLETIGVNAFYTNALTSIDLSNCTALTLIGTGAFQGNTALTSFDLPFHTVYSSLGWRDGNNLILAAGSTISVLNTYYEIPIPYTLTDDDVVVTGGVITSCSYNFAKKDIIIPDTLDGQAVIATLNAASDVAGIFYNKGIKTIKLPSTLERIGNYTLDDNIALYDLNLEDCSKLNAIGSFALCDATKLTNLDLSNCSSLASIESYAFYRCSIDSLFFEGCTSLKTIGIYAFYSNSGFGYVSFNGCDSLENIGSYSFSSNSGLKSIDLSVCPRLTLINTNAFYNCGFSSFNLPSVAGFEDYGWRDASNNSYASGASVSNLTTWYKAAIPYTLTDDDVVVTNGEIVSCSYGFAQNDIIIPDTLDGQEIIGIFDAAGTSLGAFYQKNVYSVKLPSTLKKIGKYAFYNSNLKSLDLSVCPEIETIGYMAFYSNQIATLTLDSCSSLTTIGEMAFRENALTSLDFTDCTSLIKIESRAFYTNSIPQFALPVAKGFEIYGWRDGSGNTYEGGGVVSNLDTYYEVPIPYTLTDDDVTMGNGLITSCSYSFAQKDIVIPDTLDGQKVLGIVNAGSYTAGVFYNKGIRTVKFPDDMEIIGNFAFHTNSLSALDLSNCSKLTRIGENAFTTNSTLTNVDLSACTSLIYIGAYALKTNGLSSFTLPVNSTYEALGWVDVNGTIYTGGQTISNLTIYYRVPVPYTLTDDDVVVTDGVIMSCSYNFATKDIIIPDTLDGQAVIGITGSTTFSNKGITSVKLPEMLEEIGDDCFYMNSITKLSLSNYTNLKHIGNNSFAGNSIKSLDLSGCTNLISIDSYAFYYNSINSINLSGCNSLVSIGFYAFRNNNLTSVDLSGCPSLVFIDANVFNDNVLTSFVLPVNTSYAELGWRDANWNSYTGGETVSNLYTYYKVPVPYTLTDDDVEVVDGEIITCSYSFEVKDIIIPDTLDVQEITGIAASAYSGSGIFYSKGITSLQLPSGIKNVGDYAFYYNEIFKLQLTGNQVETIGNYAFSVNNLDSLDFSNCTMLSSIGDYAFSSNQIVQLDLANCVSLENIGTYAFQNNEISVLDFSDCNSLTSIGQNAFYYNSISSLNFEGCINLESIGYNAFYSNQISSLDLSPCTSLTFIGTYSFYRNNITGFALPTPQIPGFSLSYWKDDANNHYNGGDFASNLGTNYNAILAQALLANFYVSDGVDPLSGVSIELHGYDTLLTDETGLAQFTVMTSDSIGYTAMLAGYLTVTDSISAHDSIVNEYVIMTPCSDSIELNENLCEGESYLLGETSYSESGVYTENFINQLGCDSIVVLYLTINPSGSETVYDTVCAGDLSSLGDTSYFETGVYMQTFTSQFGCDSVVTLNLTVYPRDSVTIDTTLCEGNFYLTADSTALSITGNFTENLRNGYGCDSVVNINLKVIPRETELNEVICEGGQVVIGTSVYFEPGVYSDTLSNRLGCDSIIILNLTVIPTSTILSQSICENDSAVIGNSVYRQTGTYTDTLLNHLGCDSLVILDLQVHQSDSIQIQKVICEGESVQIGDSVYSQTGFYSNILTNQHGCDSVVNLQLTVNPVQKSISEAEICEGEEYLFQGNYYDVQGNYSDTFTNQYGCDSIYMLNLTVHPTDRIVFRDTVTYGNTYSFRGTDYTSGGLYSDTLSNQFGCDSIISLLLYVYYEPIVYIPDSLFKAELLNDTLINTNHDDEIQVTEAVAYTGSIQVEGKSIQSFTGIEAFENIDSLRCANNLADSLNLSQNTKLVYVDCSDNQLVFLDLNNLEKLDELDCSENQLTVLDVSKNTGLSILNCSYNLIADLDLSISAQLLEFNGTSNKLTQLDLRNGNNTNMLVVATSNPLLSCVTVDDVGFCTNNWLGFFDPGVLFSTSCSSPDIAVAHIQFVPGEVFPGDELSINWQVVNYGNTNAAGGWNERVSLVSPGNQKLYLNGNLVYANTLPATDTVLRSAVLKIPALTGFGGPAQVMIELIPTGILLSTETINSNNKLKSDSSVFIHELLSLSISEISVFENYSNTLRGNVTRSGNSDTTLIVSLNTLSPDLSIPASVEITAGNNATNFYFTLNNNDLFDGIRVAEITAFAEGLEPVADQIEILDDDIPNLSITIDRDSCPEGEIIYATVSSEIKLDTTQTILVSASKSGQVGFNSTLTIPANDSSVQMEITIIDDSKPELDQSLILTASASGYISGKDTIILLDNDIPEIKLELLTDTLSESAGDNATWLKVTRSKDNSETITVALSTLISNEVVVPEYVHFFPGDMEELAAIDVTDNDQVDGYRNVSIVGAVYIPSCNCNSTISGRDTAVLVLTDDDGPALKLSCTPITLSEGQINQGTLNITRNASNDMTLLVYLTTNNPGELLLQDTVTIPAGSSSVGLPVMALNDSIDDGQQTVTIKASADSYSPGTVTVYTSDQSKPDLSIGPFAIAQSQIQIKEQLEFTASILNTGQLKAPSGITLDLYLSKNDKLDNTDLHLQQFTTNEVIPIGGSISIWELVSMPSNVGLYYLILRVNNNQDVTELLYLNNNSKAVPIELQADLNAMASVAEETFISAEPVLITGSAVLIDSTPAMNKEVEIYVVTQGIRRSLSATTDSEGKFSVTFEPGSNEVGHYLIGACYPGENLQTAQDEFDIMGFGRTSASWLTWYLHKGETINGSFTVKNFSNAELTGLKLNFPQKPAGFEIQVNTISVLEGNQTASFNFSVTGNAVSPGLNYIKIPVIISSDQGVKFEFTALYYCQALEGLLKTEPLSLSSSFTKDKIRYIEFIVYNSGAGNTGKVTLSLPDTDWMSLASSSVIENIAPGENAKVTLRLQSNEDTPLNLPMEGKIAINAEHCEGLLLPYRMECVSEESGNLLVDVVDEYTYNTEEAPHLANAHVKVSNPYTGKIVGETNTDSFGHAEFQDIPEGIYVLLVEAERHDGYQTTVTIDPGRTTEELVFISFQAISYSWTVVPTEIEDKYKITLELVYETNVPMPVVAIDMPQSMPVLVGDETYSFMVTLSNLGLITAEDVDLDLPENDAEYEFVFVDNKHTIAAKESIQIPVTFRRRSLEKSASLPVSSLSSTDKNGEATTNCSEMVIYAYGWKCGDDNKWERVTYPIRFERCTSDDQSDEEYFSHATDDDAWRVINTLNQVFDAVSIPSIYEGLMGQIPTIPASATNVNPGTSGTGASWLETDITGTYCNPCYDGIASALGGCFIKETAGKIFSALGCYRSLIMLDFSTQSLVDCVLGFTPFGCANGVVSALQTCYSQYKNVFDNDKSALINGEEMPANIEQAFNDLLYIEAAYNASIEWSDEFWGPVNWQEKIYLSEFAAAVSPFIDNKIPFEQNDIEVIINEFTILGFSGNEIISFADRWNSTLDAWDQNIYSPDSNFPDIIDNDLLDYAIWKTDSVNRYVQNRGASDLMDLYTNAYNDLQAEVDANRNSVCASVSLSISQKLVMTREAFRGTLSLFNGNEQSAIEEFELNLEIKNQNGELCNDLFQIEPESLSQLTAIDGTGTLPAMETGTAIILFIPEKGAAPTITQSYSFGGSISYLDPFTKTTVTKTLFPVTLEVHPSPDLYLHYFMQRDILGDDPLTENITEPVIPAELALMIENNGYGDATNIRIESAQPEIVDNEKGLLIEFELIGSNLQGVPVNMGLINIDFGTVTAQTTRIGQWWFTSSLLGHFASYSANLTHTDSRGNPELSLISGATLHELTKSISVYGALDDNIPDFLVNDIADVKENPDAIYLSQGQTVLDVYESTGGSFDQEVKAPTFTNTLTVSPRFEGWNYLKLDDPGKGLFEIASITRNNDGQEIPLENAWLTFVTMPDGKEHVYENKFHIVDDFDAMTSQTYTIAWVPLDTVPVEVVEIQGAPENPATSPVTELMVTFNKEIDPASFSFEDIGLTLENGANLSANSINITRVNALTYNVNIANLATGDGTYKFTVLTANINDNTGNTGREDHTLSWSQYLSVPAIEEFTGVPAKRTNQLFDAVQIRFNMEIDPTTLTTDDLVLERNGTVVSAALSVHQVEGSYLNFAIEGIPGAITQDAVYKLLVDLNSVRSLTGVYGESKQFAEWAFDSTPPGLFAISELTNKKLDAQHVPGLQINFSEAMEDFTKDDFELRKNNVILTSSKINVLPVSASDYQITGFDTLTYGEGSYTFTVFVDQLADIAGNYGIQENAAYSWKVDRTPPPPVTNIAVIPDLGISNLDRITTGDSISISMTVPEDNTTIYLFETNGTLKNLLAQAVVIDSGQLIIPVQFANSGQITAEIVCSDSVNNQSSAPFKVYLDNSDLQANITGASLTASAVHPDSLIVNFSDAIFTDDFDSACISIKYNDILIASDQLSITQLDAKKFVLKDIENLPLRDGRYTLSIDLRRIRELLSGRYGASSVKTNWEIEIPNSYPVADAGADAAVRQGQVYQLNGLATFDPDGDPLSYKWYFPTSLILSDVNTLTPLFVVPYDKVGTTYTLMLSASDGKLTHTDKTIITIEKAVVVDTVTATICSNEAYELGTQLINVTGIYTDTLLTMGGADSIVHLFLTVNPADSVTLTRVVCEGENIAVGDSVYNSSGIYVTTLSNQYGCDSVITLNLTANPVDSVFLNETTCEGDSVSVGDTAYFESGIFSKTLVNRFGCDSVVILDLSVHSPDTTPISATLCYGESYELNGIEYTQSGLYSQTLPSVAACDSTLMLNLTVLPETTTTLNAAICAGESYILGDSVYTARGQFNQTLRAKNGCDSLVVLNLSVNTAQEYTFDVGICEGETYNFNDSIYNSGGTFTFEYQDQNGCDSIITLILSVNPSDEVTIYDSMAGGSTYLFSGQELFEAGVYSDTLTNMYGCDSVAHLYLSVIGNEAPVIQNHQDDVNIEVGDSILLEIDLAGTIFYDADDESLNYGFSIVPEQNGWMVYELENGWLGIHLAPEIQDTGCYRVVLQAIDPLQQMVTDTFNICVTKKYDGIDDWNSAKPVFKIYPNPAQGNVSIELNVAIDTEMEVLIFDNMGRNLLRKTYTSPSGKVILDVSEYTSGIYLVTVLNGKKHYTRKLIIKQNE